MGNRNGGKERRNSVENVLQKIVKCSNKPLTQKMETFSMPGVLQHSELAVKTKKDLNFLGLKEQNSAMAKGHENCL